METPIDQHVTTFARLEKVIGMVDPDMSQESRRLVAAQIGRLDVNAFVETWQHHGNLFPAHLGRTEARIISAFLDSVLNTPSLSVAVHDEVELVVNKTRGRGEIESETAATGATTYVVFEGERRVGFAWFVHGNGCDVLTDYSDNEEMGYLVKAANDLAEELG